MEYGRIKTIAAAAFIVAVIAKIDNNHYNEGFGEHIYPNMTLTDQKTGTVCEIENPSNPSKRTSFCETEGGTLYRIDPVAVSGNLNDPQDTGYYLTQTTVVALGSDFSNTVCDDTNDGLKKAVCDSATREKTKVATTTAGFAYQ